MWEFVLEKRLGIVLLFLFATAAAVQAQNYEITLRTIYIEVDDTGTAQITEKFSLGFPDDWQKQVFREESEKLGVTLAAWKKFNSAFQPTIGGTQARVSDIGFVENDSEYLEIKYSLDEPIMKKEMETSRMVEYSLDEKFFNALIEGAFWVIPKNMTIIVDLPQQTEIEQPVKPSANVSGNRVVWTGYKSTNVISLRYAQWKQIASLTLNEIVYFIVNSEAFPLVGVVAIVLSIAILWKRKSIAAKIEGYIIEHSDLSNAREED